MQPQRDVEARQALFRIIAKAVERLETIAEAHRKLAEINAPLITDKLTFDTSVDGERIRRYEMSCSRTLLRTLAEFNKMHKASDEMDPVLPENCNGVRPVTTIEVEPEFAIDSPVPDEFSTQSIDAFASIAYKEISQPSGPLDLCMPWLSEPATIHQFQESPSEPTALTNQELPSESTAAINQELPSEPPARTRPDTEAVERSFETGSNCGAAGKQPRTGPHSRERKAGRDGERKADRDLPWFLRPSNPLIGKPTP